MTSPHLPIHAVSTSLPSNQSTPLPADSFDRHNHPRLRRDLLLTSLSHEYPATSFHTPQPQPKPPDIIQLYSRVHDPSMVQFLTEAWSRWASFGEDRYEECCHRNWNRSDPIPPMVPCHSSFRSCPFERPSGNIMGQMGYYCTDGLTPIVATLKEELEEDASVICRAVQLALEEESSVVYAVTTHPGHHANWDNFGGYCYLNNAALCARLMQRQLDGGGCVVENGEIVSDYWGSSMEGACSNEGTRCRIAVLDVDYHCGNGTASIFYKDSGIFFSSIHCDPNIEYPFNQGYVDQTGSGEGEGTTLHIPLAPGATWDGTYKAALESAMTAILNCNVSGLVVSLGLDTYEGDSVAVNRAGFNLSGRDYYEMGLCMGKFMAGRKIPTVFVQEGGYKMDVVGEAAAGVVGGFATGAIGVE